MFWSSFSVEWYEVTLRDLGFDLVCKLRQDKTFLGDVESTWYLLFKAPHQQHELNPLLNSHHYF
jgi:hypothetical protein